MRRTLATILACTVITWGLAACGGGSGSADPVSSTVGPGGSIATCAANCSDPSTPAPTCAGQGYPGTFPNCVCPESYETYTGADLATNTAGTCTGNPPPAACPVGQSLTGYGSQCCADGDAGNGSACFAPPPVATTCPSDEYGTPPSCLPIPSCSAVVGGYWGGTSCECPAGATGTYPSCQPQNVCPSGDSGTYPNCVAPPTCNAVPGAYYGGAGCECPAGQVGQYPTCVTQSSIVLTLVGPNVSPATVCDNTGPSSCQGTILTWSISSNLPGDAELCYVNNGTDATESPTSVGGYPALQDGTVTVTVTCSDLWKVTVSGTVTLTVTPPAAPPPDEFSMTANGDGTFTFVWYTYGSQGCSVYLASATGGGPFAVPTPLQPGGGTSGSATTPVLSPAYGPYSATLECGGIPDAAAIPDSYGVAP